MDALISVIVPVYKVEKYLNKCVESILAQTYKNLEIILVDDGSPDACPIMCDKWANIDARIRVIHKENGGLSDARNAGIEIAKGDYIGFVDSDDTIDKEMFECLYKRMIETDSDITSCGILRVWADENNKQPIFQGKGDHILNGSDAMQALIESSYLVMTVWNKLYKSEIVKDVLFPVGKINEDEFWSWRAVAKAKRVATIERPLYYYLQRNNGIMGNMEAEDLFLVVEAKCQRHQYILDSMPQLKNVSSMDILYTCLHQGQRLKKMLSHRKSETIIQKMNSVIRQYPPDNDYIKSMAMKKKIRYAMIHYFFAFTCSLQNILGIGL